MTTSPIRIPNINDFFETYATTLEQHDTKGMAFLHNIPCTMLSDDTTTVFTDASKLEGFFNQGMSFYRQFGIAHAKSGVWTWSHITPRITVAKVNWQYFDALRQPVYSCDYHYTLKLDKRNIWKIIQSVSINEKERMEEWKMRKQR